MLITPLNHSFKNIFFLKSYGCLKRFYPEKFTSSPLYILPHTVRVNGLKKKNRDKKCPLYRIEKDILI